MSDQKRIIVVLGMHRSGTSVITRALQVMGVELGDHLMPGTATDNQKGFWEDLDIYQLNVDLLRHLSLNWDALTPIFRDALEGEKVFALKSRAIELLREKTRSASVFGMKDPRLSRLLPFWQEVFQRCDLEARYVIAVRNPLSVSESLGARDKFAKEKAHYLWMSYVLPSLLETAGALRVVVDYDRMMEYPSVEIRRIACSLHLEDRIDEEELVKFEAEFLDQKMRHARRSARELRSDPSVPPQAAALFDKLGKMASDQLSSDSPETESFLKEASRHFEELSPALCFMTRQNEQIVHLNEETERQSAQAAAFSQSLIERDAGIAELQQGMEERDVRIKELERVVAERDAQMARLEQTMVERDSKVGRLEQTVVERDSKVGRLEQTVVERDSKVERLEQSVVERDASILNLRRSVEGLHSQVGSAREELRRIYDSRSWKLIMKLAALVSHERNPLKWTNFVGAFIRLLRKFPESLLRKLVSFYRKILVVEVLRKKIAGFFLRQYPAFYYHMEFLEQGMPFDPEFYLKQNPDVAASGIDPYEHYARYGKYERRQAASGVVPPFILRNDYRPWIDLYDTMTGAVRARMSQEISKFSFRPLIAVLMPVYNPNPLWLKQAIESVRAQLYPHWELCIADDASTDPKVRALLERYAKEDARIKVVFRSQNGHISAASNSALELVSGEWVALLDHDDLLSEHALFWVAETLQRHPEACILYSDEDKLNREGERENPYFKCDWNYDLFLSHNLISHLGIYKTRVLRLIGGFRLGMEGSQDYDLALRCLERMGPDKIQHIPHILYHWRIHAASEASEHGKAKPYAPIAAERALNDYFERQGIRAEAKAVRFGNRVRYALPEILPKVSLIIPTRNGLALIRKCVESILMKTTYPNYEILIIDNGSDDPEALRYFEEIGTKPKVRVIRDDRPFNFSALNNAAVQLAQGELIGLINNDIEVITPGWLSEMVSFALQPQVGAVGARLWYPKRTLQHGGVILGIGGCACHAHKGIPQGSPGYFGRAELSQSFSAVTAACLIIKKSLYEVVGGLNETDLPVAFNDVDFCLRLCDAGYRNLWTPYAELWHHESATRGLEDTLERSERFAREVAYMQKCWGDRLIKDPAYSPNLTLNSEDFSFAWPPR